MTPIDDEMPELPELPDAVRNAARDYNAPPELSRPDLDDMWAAIESRSFRSDIGGRVTDRGARLRARMPRWFAPRTALPIAAALVLGVAIGRSSVPAPNAFTESDVPRRMTQLDTLKLLEPYQSTTSRYLDQTAALLVALPAEVGAGRADDRFVGRAHDLLVTTRLLLDSPAANDARIRDLLEDLELVLAQVVRLQAGQGRADLDLIRQALDQRDVLPRLRTAVADFSAND